MTTEAGRDLLSCVIDGEWRSDWSKYPDLPEAIAAIEAEARAALLAELEAGVEGLVARDAGLPFRDIHGQLVTYSIPYMIVSKRAVLDLIRKAKGEK